MKLKKKKINVASSLLIFTVNFIDCDWCMYFSSSLSHFRVDCWNASADVTKLYGSFFEFSICEQYERRANEWIEWLRLFRFFLHPFSFDSHSSSAIKIDENWIFQTSSNWFSVFTHISRLLFGRLGLFSRRIIDTRQRTIQLISISVRSTWDDNHHKLVLWIFAAWALASFDRISFIHDSWMQAIDIRASEYRIKCGPSALLIQSSNLLLVFFREKANGRRSLRQSFTMYHVDMNAVCITHTTSHQHAKIQEAVI